MIRSCFNKSMIISHLLLVAAKLRLVSSNLFNCYIKQDLCTVPVAHCSTASLAICNTVVSFFFVLFCRDKSVARCSGVNYYSSISSAHMSDRWARWGERAMEKGKISRFLNPVVGPSPWEARPPPRPRSQRGNLLGPPLVTPRTRLVHVTWRQACGVCFCRCPFTRANGCLLMSVFPCLPLWWGTALLLTSSLRFLKKIPNIPM